MRRRLFFRLSLLFFLLIVILILVVVLLVPYAGARIQDFTQQLSMANVAAQVAAELRRELPDNPTVWDIQQQGTRISALMPGYAISLVQKDGTVLLTLSDRSYSDTQKIDVAPIERFLKNDRPENLPIYGDDLLHHRTVFSAAPITLPSFDGYVYITLGAASTSLFAVKFESFAVSLLAIAIPTLLLAFAGFTIWLFSRTTARLNGLLRVVEQFEEGQRDSRSRDQKLDEIGALGRSFDRMAETISASMNEIERRDRVRRELVASIAHDLRRPIVNLSARCETLEHQQGPLDVAGFARGLRTQAAGLNRLLTDLLELAKIDIGEDTQELIPIEVDSLAAESIAGFTAAAESRGISLRLDAPPEVPLVRGDPFQLGRVLANLLENAIRHTRDGGLVTVRIRPHGTQVEVAVLDTGTGISPERIERIFEPFVQGDPEGDTGISGLGLAIVRRIVEAHGGSITVGNRPEGGTEFKFDLRTTEHRGA